MKKILGLLFLFTIAVVSFTRCNNAPKDGDVGSESVERYVVPQEGGPNTYWYVIIHNTKWYYATSATELTSATQVTDNDWHVSASKPAALNQAGVTQLSNETVRRQDLPPNLRLLLSK